MGGTSFCKKNALSLIRAARLAFRPRRRASFAFTRPYSFAALFVAAGIFFAGAAFPDDFYWAGGGGDENWTTPQNWRTGNEDGDVADGYPSAYDNAYIAGDYSITVDGDISIAALNIQKSAAAYYLSDSWTTALTGSGTLSFGAMNFNRASATDGVIGTLQISCAANCSGIIETHSGTALVVQDGASLSAGAIAHIASNSIPKSQITVNGTLAVSGTIDLQGDAGGGCNSLAVALSGTVQANAIVWSSGAAYSNGGNAIDNAGTITAGANIQAAGPTSNSGTIDCASAAFLDAVSGTSGKIFVRSGNLVYSADSSGDLGNVFLGGDLENSGSGALALQALSIQTDCSIINSAAGSINVAALSGNFSATLASGTSGSIEISSFDSSAAPKIAVAAEGVRLGAGTVASLEIFSSAGAIVFGAMDVLDSVQSAGRLETQGDFSAAGTISVIAGDAFFNTSSGGTSVQAANASFTTTGNLSFGNEPADSFSVAAGALELSASLQSLSLAGTISASGGITVQKDAALAADATIDGSSADVSLQRIDGAFAFSSTGSGSLSFNANVGESEPPASITVQGPVQIAADKIISSGPHVYAGDITTSQACSFTGTVQAGAGIVANGEAAFENDLYLYSSATTAVSGTVSVAGNLFFAGGSKAAAIQANVGATNVLLLHGSLSLDSGAVLAASQDIILLGAAYSIDDTNEAAASQVAGLFAYNHASRKKAASYTDGFPDTLPDGSAISQAWTGSLSAAAGAEISAGENFYANGLSLLGSGTWTLALKDNASQSSAFAELYNSTITNCAASQKVAAAENCSASGCSNIITTRPLIKEARTVYDNVLYISFADSDGNDALIENSENEISAALASIFNSAGAYAAAYLDDECQTSVDGAGNLSAFYLKSSENWNTDASGTGAGTSESADRSGVHHSVIPYINAPKALDGLYETLRDEAKNRIAHYYSASPDTSAENGAAGKTFTATADRCAPVLTAVYTGQEMHKEPADQADYDAHNFIEFVYSEPVDISGGTTSVSESGENVQAADDLGATTNNASGVTFAGLGTTAGGKVDASLKSGSGSPHALYRNFPTEADGTANDQALKVRLSIAGYVDGTADGSHKNWVGYISSAECPSGAVTRILNEYITDKSAAQNPLSIESTAAHPLPALSVQNAEDGLHGTWDVTPPGFAPIRINGTSSWSRPATDGSQEYEFVGASYSTGTLSAIELHWFDNEPDYSESLQWFSRIGWGEAGSATECASVASYAADVRGGSRPDSLGTNATVGGIRYCSLYDANGAFSYAITGSAAYSAVTQKIQGGAESSLFAYAGTTAAAHSTGGDDGLYCKLLLDDTSLALDTTFVLRFDSDACFVTDLAGNRIQCGTVVMKSVDRTPPDFTMSAVPLGTKRMLIIFSKALNVTSLELYDSASSHTTVSALEYIPKSLELTAASGTGIEIDQNESAVCAFRTTHATGVVVALTQEAALDDITSGVFVQTVGASKYDPLSGISATITYIQDSIGNYISAGRQHAFSDFAVNAVQAQYAYDNSLLESGSPAEYGLYQEGSWAVRDWNAGQANYGTLAAGKEITLQTSLYDGTSDKSGGLDPATGGLASGTLTAFFDSAPDAASVSSKINETAGLSWRIWQPNCTSDIFSSLAGANNAPQFSLDGTENDSGVLFDIEQALSSSNWKSGDQVSFIFKLGDYTVDHFADGTNYPLYAVRLKDSADITSLDLWSFKLKSTALQRGGVTILNNVINVDNGENTVVQVDMKESGNLNVIVMTLDGNIVRYLRRGRTDAGTHYYTWNGTNNGGSKVARGLYFVRVIGPGIDETRKVMCVK